MSTIWFMVDDTDPRLNYIGSWSSLNIGNFTEGLDLDESSRTGPVYNNTLHYTTGNDTVSFRFNGSSYLGVYGTQDGTIANGQLPEIECTLDGAPTWSFVDEYPEGLTNNNMLACRADSRIGGSSPGEHELLINVTNYSNSDWYFDYITFESLVDPVLDGEVLQAGNAELIDASNYSVLTFGAGWTTDSDDSTVTSIPGSQATLKFNGTSVSLYGDLRNVSNTAAYQIDDQEPVTVQLPATVSQEAKQLLFTADNLSVGEHTVAVVFNGSQSGMPFDINFFYMTSLTTSQQASLVSSSPSSSSSSSNSTTSSHSDTGIIIGAVLGSVTAILLLILAVTLLLRKRRQVRLEAATPFEYSGLTTTPFQYQDRVHGPNPGEGSLSYVTQSKINSDTTALSPLRAEGMSTQANSGGNGDSTNALTNLKLQQRLIILQEEISRRDRQFAEGSTQQERLLTVHTDSGLRLAGEDTLGINREMVEVPPGYTAD
ncbi:hypothetical protein F5890DRAFT_1567129 [Lentinula detonsa]|uniref:Carbohydrate esterase 2 N-terminal domain-containing protein n=1 Tax=Lentinula detonsa TaxID=2804962 RepID=A0AA38PVX0_9AGAR|nr:hypothetical protein F5890DRAFT_1567129 [Lentinula detonsa]